MLLAAWSTNNRVTVFFFEHSPKLWRATVPRPPRQTVRMDAGHIHNARCMWIKTLGKEYGIAVPRAVDRYKVGPKELIPALGHSSGIINVQLGLVLMGFVTTALHIIFVVAQAVCLQDGKALRNDLKSRNMACSRRRREMMARRLMPSR